MIENSVNELKGQTEFADFLPRDEKTAAPEGYDAEGRLLNEDGPEVGTGCGPDCCDIEEAQTPADEGATDTSSGAARHLPLQGKAFGETAPLSNIDARLRTLAGEIQAITEHARVVLASAAIDIGKRLIEARGMLPEGRWYEWLEKNVDYSVRQAQVMMQLAEQFGRGELPEAFQGLGISHMTALLAAPAEEREDLAKRVQDDGLSVRELKEEIRKLKEQAKDAEQQAFDIEYTLNRTRREMEDVEAARDSAEENLKAAKRVIAESAEKVSLANAKAAAAEASAEELRRLHSDAEDRAAASAQRASDAVNRANQAAKDLAEARAKIAAMEEAAANAAPEPKTVEVVPDSVKAELDDLRAQLAEARAHATPTTVQAAPEGPTAVDKFKWFYANQMKPTFSSALSLLREVSREDGKAADMFATALVNGCKQLMNQIGEGAGV